VAGQQDHAASASDRALAGRRPAQQIQAQAAGPVGAGALALTAATTLAPGGPAALAYSNFNPAITVADGNSVIAVHTGSAASCQCR